MVASLDSAVSVRGLRKSYRRAGGGERHVVEIGRFDLVAGEQLALRGESGCGKSTFLNLLTGILAPDAGEVRVAGEAMWPAGEAQRDGVRARRIGLVFQTFNLLRGHTCLENLLLPMDFGGRAEKDRALELLTRLGVPDVAGRFPGELSVGQQQRVAVARALVNAPAVVLADEPTASLDRRHAEETVALLREVCAERHAALLFVSHDERVLADFPVVREFSALNGRLRP